MSHFSGYPFSPIAKYAAVLLGATVLLSGKAWSAHSSCHSSPPKVATRTSNIVDTAVAAGSFNTLIAAVRAAGLENDLRAKGPVTVLAPTDSAFKKLPKGTVESLLKSENRDRLIALLAYHVLPGELTAAELGNRKQVATRNGQRIRVASSCSTLTFNGSRAIKADIRASNGLIHVIDAVLLPSDQNLVQTAAKAGTFKTLIAAASEAGLAGTLSNGGPFTVFAPSDEAFGRLPKGTVASLLEPENKAKLQKILKYHVVSGRIYADEALRSRSARTLEGSSIRIAEKSSGVHIDDARVTSADIQASNGVIHVIDRVLIPGDAEKVKPQPADRLIRDTIRTGSALFNSGHHEACADLYVRTGRTLMKHSELASHRSSVNRLRIALSNSERSTCQTTRAWTMRYALDDVLLAMRR